MKSNTADIVFVFPPAQGNVGAFRSHLGVGYLRASLARDNFATAQYLNEHPGTIDEIVADILGYRPRVVGFTVYDANFLVALALAKALKRQRPDVGVVMGGPSATFGAEQILKHHEVVDACVMGEAEETGARIFATMLDGRDLDQDHLGLAFRREGAIVSNELPPLVGSNCPEVHSALDVTPSPYLSGMLIDGRAGVLSGRGCTHQCQYCVFAALGRKKLRLHSIDRVLEELDYIAAQQQRTGQNYIVPIHDDAFTLLPKRAKELCQAIIDRKLKLVLSCITRADAVDDELLRLLKQAGCISLAFGLESAVPSVLRATGKVRSPDWADPNLDPERHFIEQVKTSVIAAKKLGFHVGVSIILGLPTETAEDGAATLRFVKELPIDFYMHNFLWVFPGTPLWDTHERYGIGCTLNQVGLPATYQYAYDLLQLRPLPKCSLEQDVQMVTMLTADVLHSCDSGFTTNGGMSAVVLNGSGVPEETAAWLARNLSIGGTVVQVYPALKRREEMPQVIADRCTVGEALVPARHHAQILPRRPGKGIDALWRIVCAGADLYAKHKTHLVTLSSADGPGPLLDWLKGVPTDAALCEVADYLSDPKELVEFLRGASAAKISARLRRMPIPPDLKYAGRWVQGRAPCLTVTRIEVDAEGQVRTCSHGEPIGRVGDTRESLTRRLVELAHAAEERRGCKRCPNTHCPRCPFPGLDDQMYCSVMTQKVGVLRLLDQVRVYARLPMLLAGQREKLASD
jgi:anaerobic magnesium-protoporphyrin IX monomethyl ester cyclase